MSHGITTNDQMFSVRRVPWHGLGVVLDEYPKSIDEALDKAGLGELGLQIAGVAEAERPRGTRAMLGLA